MSERRFLWHVAAASYLFATVAGGIVARAQAPAVVASDVPVTVGQTMQNDASLADVVFVDRATGWAVGDRGVIWHTSDGGKSWRLQASGVTCRLSSACFLDRSRGWAAGSAMQPYSRASRGVLLTTTDGGATWNEVEQATLPAIARVRFFDAQRGIAAGGASPLFPSGVFTTHDGGQTWQPLPSDANGQWLAADFPDDESGAVAGAAGRFATLMRRRVVRSASAVSSSRAYRALRLAPPTEGWLVGEGGLVMLTHDLGNSWQTPPGELPDLVRENFDFNAVAAAGPHVWVAGSPGTRVLHSSDGGHSWQPQATGQNAPLRAITFVDASSGFAVGDLGTILATGDGGRTWQVQRRGGERAAVFVALAGEADVPLELLGKLGAEEAYLTAVSLLHPALDATDGRTQEALLLAGATATRLAWQFPRPPDDAARTPEELLAQLNRASDGRAVELLNRYLVRELRMWRPDVVVTHPGAPFFSDPLASLVEQLVTESIQAAADPNQFPELATDVGLGAWQVKRVFGLLPPGSPGDVRITTGQFAPRLGATLADWAESPRRLLSSEPTEAPEMIELQRLMDAAPSDSPNLFAGIQLTPGGDARRRLANLPSDDVEQLRRLATRRRQMRMLIERTQGNAAWAAQISHLTDDLDPASAGELLFELAEGYRAAGKLDLAADTCSSLARRWPEHPLVEPALTWLVQFYASSETAQRLADRDATNYRPSAAEQPSANAVEQASATLRVDAAPVMGLSRDNRLERARALGRYLEAARPSLYAEPSIRFPLVVAQRQLGFGNPAQRYFLTLRSLPESDPWRRCGQTEEWFAKSEGLPPPKKLGNCRRAAERPHLDGRLDEPLWQSADRLRLRGDAGQTILPVTNTNEAETDKIVHPTVCFTYDNVFLYLAIQCPKAKDADYSLDDRPRPRDAELSAHDRVVVRLDVDRDYTTAYELAVDHRGWTHDACWNDATWNPTWFVAAAADESTWTVEAAIPLAQLTGAPPDTKHVWAASLVRTIPHVGDESWSGDATSEDSPDKYGLLIFE
ncbi:MAG: YCF48-related protein [Pirellulales bacterium]